MKLASVVLTGIVMWLAAGALTPARAEFIISSVIREFPMKTDDLTYRDYYINAGSNNGLKKGAFIDAFRKTSAFDNINSKLLGDVSFKIARLQLIHVDKNVSIARLVKLYEKEITPLTMIDSVMIGDLIEVSDKQ